MTRSPDTAAPANTAAPADAAPHPRWALWKIVLTYLIFFAVASASVVVIDRDVMRAAAMSAVTLPAASPPAAAGQAKTPPPK